MREILHRTPSISFAVTDHSAIPELVSLKNLDVLYAWSRDINAFKVKNIE
jgi:hypothetical protein